MKTLFLLSLTENDKRLIIGITIAIILVFVIIGLIGSLVVKTMKFQGRKCDTLISDVVINRIVTNPRQLRKYARKKNLRYFIKQAWLPLIFMLIGFGALAIHNYRNGGDWTYNPFNTVDGFGTLVYTWDFSDPEIYSNIFGVTVLSDWPKVSNEPHFVMEAIYSYVFVVFSFIGLLWYLIVSQGYLARTLRAIELSKKVFEKSLENFNQNTLPPNPDSLQQ